MNKPFTQPDKAPLRKDETHMTTKIVSASSPFYEHQDAQGVRQRRLGMIPAGGIVWEYHEGGYRRLCEGPCVVECLESGDPRTPGLYQIIRAG